MTVNVNTGDAAAGLYGISVIQSVAGTRIRWANNWYVRFRTDVTVGQYTSFADSLASFHSRMLLSPFRVEYVRISTFTPDTDPYNANEFVTVPVSYDGFRSATGQPLANDVCLFVTRNVWAGRQGKLFFRGFLTEDDITSAQGRFVLNNVSAIENYIQGSLNATGLQTFIASPPNNPIVIVMPPRNTIPAREITGLSVKGVSVNKQDRRYYDRSNQ